MSISISLLVFAVIFFAALTQSLTGFGSGLVAMGFLASTLGVRTAAPLMVLVTTTLEAVLLLRGRAVLKWRAVWRLLLGAALGIPVGIAAVRIVPEEAVLTALGLMLMAYGAYALIRPALPKLERSAWAYGCGFLSGLLGGAYNAAGPPVIIYGDSQGWNPPTFKSNLQFFFLFIDALLLTGHAVGRNYTPAVWGGFRVALPAVALGIVAGLGLERLIPAAGFRRLVLALLIVMGARLVIQ
jgi:uncharacterized membrane protein YfcA